MDTKPNGSANHRAQMPAPRSLAGMRFGRLVVTAQGPRGLGRQRWIAQCDCGGTTTALRSHLLIGTTRSCGCLHRERMAALNFRHGQSHGRIWNAWESMVRRCTDTRVDAYPRYGGRGITVCERWRTFENFAADMGPHPGKGFSIDRIDNDGHYEPGNCRWATQREQQRNRSSNVPVEINGTTRILVEWSELSGVKLCTIWRRLERGWDPHRAVFERP